MHLRPAVPKLIIQMLPIRIRPGLALLKEDSEISEKVMVIRPSLPGLLDTLMHNWITVLLGHLYETVDGRDATLDAEDSSRQFRRRLT